MTRLVKLAQEHTASRWPSWSLKSAFNEQHLVNTGSSGFLPCQLSAPLSDCPWASKQRRRRRRLRPKSSETDQQERAGAAFGIQVSLSPGPFLADVRAKARVVAEGSPARQKFPGEIRRSRISLDQPRPILPQVGGSIWAPTAALSTGD